MFVRFNPYIFMQIFQQFTSREFVDDWIELMNMDWEDYHDFETRYGSDNNPENYSKRQSVWIIMNGLGAMLDEGIVESEKVLKLVAFFPIYLWEKFQPIIYEQRVRYKIPSAYQYWEQLVAELKEEVIRQDGKVDVPDQFTRYIPDQ